MKQIERDEAYSFLVDFINQGFITLGLVYKDFNVVLKSLTDIEVNYLKVKNNVSRYDLVPPIDRLIYSTHFLGGFDVLHNRSENISLISEFYDSLPASLVGRVLQKVDDLFLTFVDCNRYIEGFCFTSQSRGIWYSKKISMNSGIVGDPTGHFLNNVIRDKWVASNVSLDVEEIENRETDLAFFVASAHNPKGVKSASNSLKSQRDKRSKERSEIAESGYSLKRVNERKKENTWSKPLVTGEDLVRELARVSKGEKDKHDLFIDQWIQSKIDRSKVLEIKREERAEKYRREVSDLMLDQEGSRRASPEDIHQLMSNGRGKAVFTDKYLSAYNGNDEGEQFIKRVGSRILKGDD